MKRTRWSLRIEREKDEEKTAAAAAAAWRSKKHKKHNKKHLRPCHSLDASGLSCPAVPYPTPAESAQCCPNPAEPARPSLPDSSLVPYPILQCRPVWPALDVRRRNHFLRPSVGRNLQGGEVGTSRIFCRLANSRAFRELRTFAFVVSSPANHHQLTHPSSDSLVTCFASLVTLDVRVGFKRRQKSRWSLFLRNY